MNKTRNTLFILLYIFISCGQSGNKNIASSQDIYDFMKVVIKEQKLNLDYGLRIEPQSSFSIQESDQTTFNSLLSELKEKKREIADPIKNKTDSLNWFIELNSKTLLSDLTKEDISEMISQKERLKTFQWNNSGLGFNISNKKRWYSFSVPLFSKDKSKAVMMIKELCPGLCGTGKTILFEKQNGIWNSKTERSWFH